MGSVILGTNKITNCQVIIALKEQALLQVAFSPLRISLKLPQDVPIGTSFDIVDNVIKNGVASDPDLRVVAAPTNVSIFWKDLLILSATMLHEETAHLKLDLRPVGLFIFDDPQGLHIGGNLMARASFANCMAAISLG
ncbi:MAG: hypothetical protein JXA73_18175 [Acidobacteria bacterium]|nr:hypothetical protein [Acidobacteriota bacterium]